MKNAEVFRDYAFTVEGDLLTDPCRARFVLTAAATPSGDTKGDARYFFPRPDAVEWDADERSLAFPFEYRLPTTEEASSFGRTGIQGSILEEAFDDLVAAIPDAAVRAALAPERRGDDGDTSDRPLLLRHLRRFVRRNTSDYFVHRDLKGFLERELEFYLKDRVLHLPDLHGDLAGRRRGRRGPARRS